MKSRLAVVAVSVVVLGLLAGTFLIFTQQGASTTTESQSTTSFLTGGSNINPENLQLRLAANAYSAGGPNGNVTIEITAYEYNVLASANNVSSATDWGLEGVSLGPCGTSTYPFGIALYSGDYSAKNVSQATPLRIYPFVACPMLVRLVTGYLFQPTGDLAEVLPNGGNATAEPMSGNVTATTQYSSGASLSSAPLGPGSYTVAAADEWGSVVLLHLAIGSSTGASSSTTVTGQLGTLGASFSIGPIVPVCSSNATSGPAPEPYSSMAAVVNSSSGQVTTLPINWVSNGCEVLGVVQTSLTPGSYSLSLSSCTFTGCASSLPKSFVIVAGQSISVDVTISTGIA